MTYFVVCYDITQDEEGNRDYSVVDALAGSDFDSVHVQESVFFVASKKYKTAKKLLEHLKGTIDTVNDELAVIPLKKMPALHNAPENVLKWLEKYTKPKKRRS